MAREQAEMSGKSRTKGRRLDPGAIDQDCAFAEFGPDQPLTLDCGLSLSPFTIAYKTYGALNADKANAVLVCHALTGDQYVASTHPLTGKAGWWDLVVGPGLPIDTDRYFVICANVLGSCMGTTGPASINPETGKAYGLDFPVITIADMVRAQAMLLDHLGIDDVFCVTGGSMGGMQVLQFVADYPDRAFTAMPIATAAPDGAARDQPVRGRHVGGDGRPRLAWRALHGSRLQPAQGSGGGPHGRPRDLPVGDRAAP